MLKITDILFRVNTDIKYYQMNNNNTNSKKVVEKSYTIEDFSHGDWVCFLLSNNKKCTGIIIEMMIPQKDNNMFFDSIKVINYIDEDGLHGSIREKELKRNQRVYCINMKQFFERKFTVSIEENNKNESRLIARNLIKQSNLKRTGNIHKN